MTTTQHAITKTTQQNNFEVTNDSSYRRQVFVTLYCCQPCKAMQNHTAAQYLHPTREAFGHTIPAEGEPTRQCCIGFSASRSRTSSMSEALLCGVKWGGRLKCAASCIFCSSVNEPSRASSLGASLTRFAYNLVEAGSLLYCTLPAAHLLPWFKQSNEYLHCTVHNDD